MRLKIIVEDPNNHVIEKLIKDDVCQIKSTKSLRSNKKRMSRLEGLFAL